MQTLSKLIMPALNVPGTALATLTTPSTASATGAALLDLRLAAVLTHCKVKKEHMDLLGNSDCDSAQVFAHVAKTDEKFDKYLKSVFKLDPDTRGEDTIPAARLHIVEGLVLAQAAADEVVAAVRKSAESILGAPEGSLDAKKAAIKEVCQEEMNRLEQQKPPKKQKRKKATLGAEGGEADDDHHREHDDDVHDPQS